MSNGFYRPSGFGGFTFFPPVIKNLLIANAAIYVITLLAQNITFNGMPSYYILMKYFALQPLQSGEFQIWQPVTYQFLHGSFSHIFFNLFGLWMFGAEIEQEWGSRKFLVYYLACGIGGAAFQLFLNPLFTGEIAATIGASGAIFGIMIAFALMFPDRYIYLYFFIPVKTKYFIAFLILLNLFAVNDGSSGVAHLAHLGGAFIGFLFMMLDKNMSFDLKNRFSGRRRGVNWDNYSGSQRTSSWADNFRRQQDVEDARFSDVQQEDEITQEEIDAILDKISRGGYESLTASEKRILFEASRKMK